MNRNNRRSAAFTLVEVLVTLTIVGTLAGAVRFAPVSLFRRDDTKAEAQHLARWLMGIITISNQTGRAFTLDCPGNESRETLSVVFQSPREEVKYVPRGKCSFRRYNSNATAESFYLPRWNTLTPALTIRVANARGEWHFVIVSLYGRVRTDSFPSAGSS
ncbi:MAG: prepilin-type N-terminal cleavage/methylation domain-containing protein [Synergistaceae bacterium]|jgi:prepilin-type N-terminal cleavage/methylation domain-containing protein|nr:prepilin-type N-terminal cleavage/methylation domain-containing protein [Synergistaceae bacterium]